MKCTLFMESADCLLSVCPMERGNPESAGGNSRAKRWLSIGPTRAGPSGCVPAACAGDRDLRRSKVTGAQNSMATTASLPHRLAQPWRCY